MFEKGEYIIYGSNGVCEVQDYMNAAGETDNRTYYVLAPMRSKGSTIFSPVDNQKVLMRKVMTKEEGEAVGIEIAREVMAQTADFVDGYYFSFPFNRVYLLEKILQL